MSSQVPPPERRLPWVDLAKGLCIIAVVALWTGRQMQWDAGWIVSFERFARPFRMPDFFLLSGLFVGAVLHRPWRSYLDTKVVHFAYFLVLWTFIIVPIAWLGGTQRPATVPAMLGELAVKMFYKPEAMLWFILMLPVFFVVTRLLQRVSPLLVLNAAAVLAMLRLHTGVYPLDWFAKYFVFFYAGHVLSGAVLALAKAVPHRPVVAVVALLAWAGLNHLFTTSDFAEAVLAPLSWTAPLRWLGAHSIVVYLGFYVPLMVLIRVVRRVAPQLDAGSAATLVWAGSIAIAVGLYLLLRRTPLRYLYERPAWARLRAGAGAASPAVQSAPSSTA
jgi:uncharacterized membrane protein YcfT